jgi:membrane-associated phospholipid phosphatase
VTAINPKLGSAAFAIAVVTMIVAYVQWVAHVTVPAEVIAPTDVVVGSIVGWFTPSS